MRENEYQSKLIKKIKAMLPNCIVLKNDTDYIQGIPDLMILNGPTWAALEVKASATSSKQPNQDWYVKLMDAMSYAAFISPDNESEVLAKLREVLT